MSDIFEYEVIFDDDDVKLQDYDKMLSSFKQWTQFKREIKLTTLLEEGKRIQYDIDDIISNTPIYGTLNINDNFSIISLKDTSFVVNGMSFIINGDNVDKLKIKIRVLDTDVGKIMKDFILLGGIPKIKQKKTGAERVRFYMDSFDL